MWTQRIVELIFGFSFLILQKRPIYKLLENPHFIMLQIFQVFLKNTFFQMAKIQHQKIIITAWVSK
jgi:hypothetical protein